MTMITPSYLGETIEYSSLHACRSTLEDPTNENYGDLLQQRCRHIHEPTDHVARGTHVGLHSGGGAMQVDGEQDDGRADKHGEQRMEQIREIAVPFRRNILNARFVFAGWEVVRHY